MNRSYPPTENIKQQVAVDTPSTGACSSSAGITSYENVELRKYCVQMASERFGCGDSGSAIHMAEYLYEWIKTGKQKA